MGMCSQSRLLSAWLTRPIDYNATLVVVLHHVAAYMPGSPQVPAQASRMYLLWLTHGCIPNGFLVPCPDFTVRML